MADYVMAIVADMGTEGHSIITSSIFPMMRGVGKEDFFILRCPKCGKYNNLDERSLWRAG